MNSTETDLIATHPNGQETTAALPQGSAEPDRSDPKILAPMTTGDVFTEPSSMSEIAAGEVADVAAMLQAVVDSGYERVQKLIEDQHATDRFREGQIDRLHAELQDYKRDLVSKATRPVFQALVRLHDDLGKMLDALRSEDPSLLTPERALRVLDGFRDDVELALESNGVSVYRAETEVFDPRRQRVVRTVETLDDAKVGRVAERVRPGFDQDGHVLEKERVAVFVSAPTPAAGAEKGDGNG